MEENVIRIYEGQLLEEENSITLVQLCSYCRLAPDEIIEMVEEGIIEPSGKSKREWRFPFTLVERVQKAQRLINDLDINLAGAALALHLLDRIEELESMRRLDRISEH